MEITSATPYEGYPRGRAHKWLLRLFLLFSAIFLRLTILGASYALTGSQFGDDVTFYVLVMIHLSVLMFVVALACCNFHRILLRIGQLFLLTGIIVLTPYLVGVVAAFVKVGLPALNRIQDKSWHPTVLSALMVLVGLGLINWQRRIPARSSSESAAPTMHPRPELASAMRLPMWLRRISACILDYIVFIMILVCLNFALSGFRAVLQSGSILLGGATPVTDYISLWAWVAYFVGIESIWGKTPGQIAFGLAVVREFPTDRRIMASVLRHTWDILEIFPFGIPAAIISLVRRDGKRLGDIIAGTRVISTW